MQVGDENVIDPKEPHFVFPELNLCSFTTVYQKELFIELNHLSSGKTLGSGQCSAATEYCNLEFHNKKKPPTEFGEVLNAFKLAYLLMMSRFVSTPFDVSIL